MTLMETAQLLGNFGEFFAAIAVVATLFYLAIQVRQSNQLAKRSEMNTGHDQTSRLRLAMAVDRDLAELIARGNTEPASLDAVDKSRFDAFVLTFVRLSFQAWDRARAGLLDKREWKIMRDYTGEVLSSPGGSVWWPENRNGFIDEYQIEIETAMFGDHTQ